MMACFPAGADLITAFKMPEPIVSQHIAPCFLKQSFVSSCESVSLEIIS